MSLQTFRSARCFCQNGFFSDFHFRAARSFLGSQSPIFPSFLRTSPQKSPPGKSSAKASRFHITKISDTFLQRGQAYAGSGLPQGPFLGNNLFPLKVGLRWVFVNGLEWVQKWVKSEFLGAKVGQNASRPTFAPTLNPFRGFHENPLFTQLKGGGNCFLRRALRQS